MARTDSEQRNTKITTSNAHRLTIAVLTEKEIQAKLEAWDKGAKPNTQASALILIVRKYPETHEKLNLLGNQTAQQYWEAFHLSMDNE